MPLAKLSSKIALWRLLSMEHSSSVRKAWRGQVRSAVVAGYDTPTTTWSDHLLRLITRQRKLAAALVGAALLAGAATFVMTRQMSQLQQQLGLTIESATPTGLTRVWNKLTGRSLGVPGASVVMLTQPAVGASLFDAPLQPSFASDWPGQASSLPSSTPIYRDMCLDSASLHSTVLGLSASARLEKLAASSPNAAMLATLSGVLGAITASTMVSAFPDDDEVEQVVPAPAPASSPSSDSWYDAGWLQSGRLHSSTSTTQLHQAALPLRDLLDRGAGTTISVPKPKGAPCLLLSAAQRAARGLPYWPIPSPALPSAGAVTCVPARVLCPGLWERLRQERNAARAWARAQRSGYAAHMNSALPDIEAAATLRAVALWAVLALHEPGPWHALRAAARKPARHAWSPGMQTALQYMQSTAALIGAAVSAAAVQADAALAALPWHEWSAAMSSAVERSSMPPTVRRLLHRQLGKHGLAADGRSVSAGAVASSGRAGDCPVCLESLAGHEEVLELVPCGHCMHAQCAASGLAVAHLARAGCPLCRVHPSHFIRQVQPAVGAGSGPAAWPVSSIGLPSDGENSSAPPLPGSARRLYPDMPDGWLPAVRISSLLAAAPVLWDAHSELDQSTAESNIAGLRRSVHAWILHARAHVHNAMGSPTLDGGACVLRGQRSMDPALVLSCWSSVLWSPWRDPAQARRCSLFPLPESSPRAQSSSGSSDDSGPAGKRRPSGYSVPSTSPSGSSFSSHDIAHLPAMRGWQLSAQAAASSATPLSFQDSLAWHSASRHVLDGQAAATRVFSL